ncbi:hypothetical protein BKA66DRAFT_430136 [Pyrenochaeta sp. MPI-SDFR-AT-0127]|nr:hypothetical protein BKA66DRAFT_430136 [Pyrenochaeta sp. MPI-SDFR-AT-0127]
MISIFSERTRQNRYVHCSASSDQLSAIFLRFFSYIVTSDQSVTKSQADPDARRGEPREPQNSQQKRKEQVRRAQKTHRERKEAYTTSLEAEVIQLRANEARILQETKTLYAHISMLKRMLAENGISVIPAHREVTTQLVLIDGVSRLPERNGSSPTTDITFKITQKGNGRNCRKQICAQKISSLDGQKQYPEEQSAMLIPSHSSPANASSTEDGSSDLDPAVVGVDFVLTLESPCLPHIDVAHSSHTPSSTGHALTVSACLLHHRPTQATSPVAWQLSSTGIERLLELSRAISLEDGEVTPVQAWDYIRQHAQYAGLEIARWECLKEKLVLHVKCYGFGGVIARGVFEDLVFEAFVVGRIF